MVFIFLDIATKIYSIIQQQGYNQYIISLSVRAAKFKVFT